MHVHTNMEGGVHELYRDRSRNIGSQTPAHAGGWENFKDCQPRIPNQFPKTWLVAAESAGLVPGDDSRIGRAFAELR